MLLMRVCLKCCFLAGWLFASFAPAATFTNPIDSSGQDPWVIQWRGDYYYCWSAGTSIRISRAARLQDIATEPATTIWTAPAGQPYSQNIWAPELHYLQNRWYVYFAADDGANENHRMYVLESTTEDPFSLYTLRGKIYDPADRWAIDGTVLEQAGKLYFIWSGWEANVNTQQNLYIAPMSNPWTISSNRTLISQPLNSWERVGGPPYINEGPQVLKRGTNTFVIYSASGSWTDDYCLGQLRLTGTNVLLPTSWTKLTTPVFAKTAQVFGPGHASFVKSTDQTQDWIVYHAAKYSGAGWNRDVRMQSFSWNANGSPNFGTPVNTNVHLVEPSGSPCGTTYEAETALVNHATIVANTRASNSNKVGLIDFADSYVQFSVNAAKAGQYRLYVRYGAGLGAATHLLSVNGVSAGTVSYAAGAWDDWDFNTNSLVNLQAGTNTIRLTKGSGYAELDFLGVNPGPEWDTDADGLGDTWERTYFDHLYDPAGATTTDTDGDKQSTLQEYIADTNPTNSSSYLGLTGILAAYPNLTVQWRGGILATQFLERSDSLNPNPIWITVFTNLPPTTASVSRNDNPTNRAAVFYRVRASR